MRKYLNTLQILKLMKLGIKLESYDILSLAQLLPEGLICDNYLLVFTKRAIHYVSIEKDEIVSILHTENVNGEYIDAIFNMVCFIKENFKNKL